MTIYRIAKLLGRDPSPLYKIRAGKLRCPEGLAHELEALKIPGWRLSDTRPDLVARLERLKQDVQFL